MTDANQVCRSPRELMAALQSLTDEQLDSYELQISVSEDVPSGEVHVEADDKKNLVWVVGSSDDL